MERPAHIISGINSDPEYCPTLQEQHKLLQWIANLEAENESLTTQTQELRDNLRRTFDLMAEQE